MAAKRWIQDRQLAPVAMLCLRPGYNMHNAAHSKLYVCISLFDEASIMLLMSLNARLEKVQLVLLLRKILKNI